MTRDHLTPKCTGHVEAHSMSDVIFQSMQRTFDTYGYTLDPETGKVVGNVEKAASLGGVFFGIPLKRMLTSHTQPRE